MNNDADTVELDPEDLAAIKSMSRTEALAAADAEEHWVAYLERYGRKPSPANEFTMAYFTARARACRDHVQAMRRR